MKFCIVRDKRTNKILGQEYEHPWSYSEYTTGGGGFNTEWIDLSDCFGTVSEERKPLIFETKLKATEFVKHEYICGGKDIEIIMLKEDE